MAFKKNEVITRMDRVVMQVAGPPGTADYNPRLSIFANLVFMAMSLVGLVITARGGFGPGLVFAAMLLSSTHTIIVEQQKRGSARLDEREWGIFWKAMAIGAFVPCVLVAVWALLLGNFADQGMWYPDRSEEWQATAFFVLGLMGQIANIAQAWMTPAYAAELLDDD